MEIFNKCIVALKNARSDTEKFAALLLVPKLLKSGMSSSLKSELFQAIGVNFLHRLLHTAAVPNECPSHVFKSVALSIMAAFCTDANCDSEIVTVVCQEVSVLKDLLQKTLIEDQIVDDVLCCFNRVALDVSRQKCLIEAGVLDSLTDRCLLGNHCHGECLSLLLSLLQSHPKECWMVSAESLTKLLFVQSSAFKNDLTIHKFQLASYLVVLLNSLPEDEECKQEWICDIQEGIFGVLTSKIFKDYRKPILMLVCLLFMKFGPTMITTLHDSKKLDRFLIVLLHIVCIEVQIILDEVLLLDIAKEKIILFTCYGILETILMVSNELWDMIQEHIEKVLSSLKLAFSSIVTFLNSLASEWDMWVASNDANICAEAREIAFATVRVLCSWMSEESLVLRKEICGTIPFVLKLAKENANFLNENCPAEGQKTVGLMQCLLPALCHLSADDYYHRVMIEENIPRVLLEYVRDTWEKDDEEENFHTIIVTSCSVFLNFVVMDGCAIAQDEAFFEFLKFLMVALPDLGRQKKTDAKRLEIVANFAVLGLLIARRFFGRVKSCELEFHKFLAASVKFLWDAHSLVSSNTPTFGITFPEEYHQIQPKVMEYWFLGMQALSSLLPLLPWIAVFLIDSGWPQHVINSLRTVDGKLVKDSIKSAYQEILCSLVKSNPNSANVLIECGALEVCSNHNMKEFEQILNLK